jgi:hypothetical protein
MFRDIYRVTKTIGDYYRIYSMIIILNIGFIASVRCGLFKMSNVSHLTMVLPLLLKLDKTLIVSNNGSKQDKPSNVWRSQKRFRFNLV